MKTSPITSEAYLFYGMTEMQIGDIKKAAFIWMVYSVLVNTLTFTNKAFFELWLFVK